MNQQDALFEYLLRLGDNALILGHRLSEWCGHSPALEEDLALSNVALDLIGQTQLWLNLAGEVEGKGRDADKLAYLRDGRDFRNVLLVEQPNGDFAVTMARQFYFDAWHYLLLRELAGSRDPRIAEIAAKGLKEVTYHLERSRDWVLRLGDGTEESHRRMQTAIEDLWMYTGELFESDEIDQAMAGEGLGPDLATLQEPWLGLVRATAEEATLSLPQPGWAQKGGKRGIHSEHLGYILADLQFLQRAYPNATW
ncbi:1,2-phenylacetyl-CoA epoxidase subunit PaaC [Microvirga tunisiensis]|jgi:ring-1,2-phenylacetyl-CoA epoxidase subunit PaaC|uniref:Phenylacetate-CoA oxygenase subunit PaaC n=1 Tax=Microvirga tunisiensis TaxID=2108360 RepID=A0A5N7MH27_9HYPH|nr:1,2-phenylacetyl-CoA epoxidase subunit PaaC [Microvirga tunisiensis]MPR08194.1 phenylacetate-CoA oxygenase subunit PaaC [Microvirga tunisiensis]MPR26401.1 phenylacetate-CoA oxygenase subunit PaaC [Microvirga tunisiensis]